MKRLLCRDVGLDCDYVVLGESEEEVTDNALKHAWEGHAISAKEMTSDMRARIREHIASVD
jgi:predicted small metal-binding protein